MKGLGNSRNVSLAMRDRGMRPTDVAPTVPAREICDLAVHLDGSRQDENRLVFAEMLAVTFEARVEACLSQCFAPAPLSGAFIGGWAPESLHDGDVSPGGSDERKLRARVSRIKAPSAFQRYDGMAYELAQALARRARTVDVFVLGQPIGRQDPRPQFVEAVLFHSSAPIFVVPPASQHRPSLQTVMIGWKDTLECSRAITASLPFLKQARRVLLTSVLEGGDERPGRASADEMATHLANHGITVEIRSLAKGKDIAGRLLEEAATVEADLVVAGAYGRSSFSEMIFGGVTRHILTHSSVPLLLAH